MIKILIIFGTLLSTQLVGQLENKFTYFAETNLVRYADTPNQFDLDLGYSVDFLNGLKVGIYKPNDKEVYLSLLKVQATVNISSTDLILYAWEGYQVGLGMNKVIFDSNNISFQVGGEILSQYNSYHGEYFGPLDGLQSVSQVRSYAYGIATIFQMKYSLSKLLSVVLNSKFGIFHTITRDRQDFWNSSEINFSIEPISSLGFRIDF